MSENQQKPDYWSKDGEIAELKMLVKRYEGLYKNLWDDRESFKTLYKNEIEFWRNATMQNMDFVKEQNAIIDQLKAQIEKLTGVVND